MATIKLPFFRGLVPRQDEQHMEQGQAVKAVNTDLDSGELRPLIQPHREKVFPRAGEPGFLSPRPVDPSDPGPVDPTDPGIPGVPVPPGCIPVTIVTPPADASFSYLPDDITFTVALNADATVPVTIRWYIDDVLIAGETGTTLTITPDALQIEYNNGELVLSPNIPVITRLYGVIKVVAQNPCGIAEAFATVTIENAYSCAAFYQSLLSSGGGLRFAFPAGQNHYLQEEYDLGSGYTIRPIATSVGQLLQPIPSSSAYRLWRKDLVFPECGQEGEIVYGLGTYANPTNQFGPGFSVVGPSPNRIIFAHADGFSTMGVYNGLYRLRVGYEWLDGGVPKSSTRDIIAYWGNSANAGLGFNLLGWSSPTFFGHPGFGAMNFMAIEFTFSLEIIPHPSLSPPATIVRGHATGRITTNETVIQQTSSRDLHSSQANQTGLVETFRSGAFLGGITANLAVVGGITEGVDVNAAYQAFLNNFQGDPP